MTPDIAVDLVRQAQFLIILLVLVIIGPSLLVGLVVAIFQAATQINEQTMSFLPRLITTFVVIIVAGPWIVNKIMDLTTQVFFILPMLAP